MHILLLFLDGVGIGRRDPAVNPFATAPMPNLRGLLSGRLPFLDEPALNGAGATVVPLDATLGVPGLPQSATGATALLTGRNAPRQIGMHFGPYPNPALQSMLAQGNLFRWMQEHAGRAAFANAYPPIYLDRLARGKGRRSATTQAALAAGLPLCGFDDLRAGRAVSAFLTNERWVQAGFGDVPIITPRQAGQRLYQVSRQHTFTLFEYFLTDIAGHRPERINPLTVLTQLDEFIGGILADFDPADSLLLITSDHGNLEDSTHRKHTLNPVPAILVGQDTQELARGLRSLVDVTPTLLYQVSGVRYQQSGVSI